MERTTGGHEVPEGRDALPAVREPLSAMRDVPPAVDVTDLGIRYDLRLTRRSTLKNSLGGMVKGRSGQNHFWALRHVTFRLEHGESLGIVGPNGAGKSTLLLALAGILEPSEGDLEVRGRISTLLTLGAGFEMELTGRDNIDLTGAFLGLEDDEMTALVPAITEFADIGSFIDAPVKTYSMGMRARLGFAIATAVAPDILLLDEVLGTGDQAFRAKSQTRIHELVERAKAIVLVTHDLTYIEEFCTRALLMEGGAILADGSPSEIVRVYRERSEGRSVVQETEARRFGEAVAPQRLD